jgi:phage terminase Nu1 subunit (DNA packaging protein)
VAGGHGGHREGAGRKPAGYEHPDGRADYEKERAEHERVKREQREFKLAQERGEFVSRQAVRQATSTALALLTQSVRSVPDNCERQLALAPEVVEMIQTQIDLALSEVARAFQSLAGE